MKSTLYFVVYLLGNMATLIMIWTKEVDYLTIVGYTVMAALILINFLKKYSKEMKHYHAFLLVRTGYLQTFTGIMSMFTRKDLFSSLEDFKIEAFAGPIIYALGTSVLGYIFASLWERQDAGEGSGKGEGVLKIDIDTEKIKDAIEELKDSVADLTRVVKESSPAIEELKESLGEVKGLGGALSEVRKEVEKSIEPAKKLATGFSTVHDMLKSLDRMISYMVSGKGVKS